MNTFWLWVIDVVILALFVFSLYWFQINSSKLTKFVSGVAAFFLGVVGIVLFFSLVS